MSTAAIRTVESERIWGVVAIVRLRLPAPERLLHALLDGGVGLVEVTLTTPDAVSTIDRWARASRGQVTDGPTGTSGPLVGTGTVRTPKDVDRSADAGAQFLVTPTTIPDVLSRAAERGLPVLCGALTPTEVDTARAAGAHAIKVFPVNALGGPGYIRALRAPLPDVRLFPTGGVDVDQASRYAALGCQGVGIGASIVDDATVEAEDWSEITRRSRAFTEAWSTGCQGAQESDDAGHRGTSREPS